MRVDKMTTETLWTAFITVVVMGTASGLIMLFIKRLFKDRDKKDEQIALLVKQQEDIVRKDVEHSRKQTADTLKMVTETLAQKVPWDHCTERRRVRDLEAVAFENSLKMAEMSDTKNDYLHTTITDTLGRLQATIDKNEENAVEIRNMLFDKLSVIDVTLKLINGTIRDTKEALAVHIVKGHGGD
jgi:hypothetical protein